MTEGMTSVLEGLYGRRRLIAWAIYAVIAAFSYATAFILRYEFHVPPAQFQLFLLTLPLLLLVRLGVDRAFNLTRQRWRYVGTSDVARLLTATVVGSIIFLLATLLLPLPGPIPFSIFLMEAVLTGYVTGGAWLSYRIAVEQVRRSRMEMPESMRTIIVGAGEAGSLLVREMLRSRTLYEPIGFVDDDVTMAGATLHGLPVLGTTADLQRVAKEEHADKLILAVPSASPTDMRRIVDSCEATELPYKVLPGIAEVIAGRVSLQQLRDVRIEDLLGREPINLHLPELAADLADRVVLVTGAAGSIGSELVRQIAMHSPRALVILDQAETPLFFLELELREAHPGLTIYPVIADIADHAAVEQVFAAYRPDRVFHAAAYKHVPMMELNAREAVQNNVIGTWHVADAAGRHGTERFVLVSTDKAVRPTNIMGATKRLAEITILELQEQYPGTAYGAVRFGNVLGSAGSVIPVFKRQLEKGLPLTVTHPEMTRYFMTIPEASQLILQSSLLEECRGNIAMLEMGEPVRILDLARNLLRLSGYSGDLSRKITFTGMRPGEKMHEELIAPEEQSIPTVLDKVTVLRTARFRGFVVSRHLPAWVTMLNSGTEDTVLSEIHALFPAVPAQGRRSVTREAIAAAS